MTGDARANLMRVRRRPAPGDARPVGCATVLLVFSLVFAVASVPSLPGFGAVVYLLVGVAGTVLFAGGLATLAGQLLSGRPVLELDEKGVRLPAAWPWPRTRDRFLPWPDVAAAVVWSRPTGHGKRTPPGSLAFLPTSEHAEETEAAPSAELLALRPPDLPGTATEHWSLPVLPGWDSALDDVLAAVRERGVPAADTRSR